VVDPDRFARDCAVATELTTSNAVPNANAVLIAPLPFLSFSRTPFTLASPNAAAVPQYCIVIPPLAAPHRDNFFASHPARAAWLRAAVQAIRRLLGFLPGVLKYQHYANKIAHLSTAVKKNIMFSGSPGNPFTPMLCQHTH